MDDNRFKAVLNLDNDFEERVEIKVYDKDDDTVWLTFVEWDNEEYLFEMTFEQVTVFLDLLTKLILWKKGKENAQKET